MNLPVLSVILLVSFTGLGVLFLRLQKELNGCVNKIDAGAGGKFQPDRSHEFYNAFADRQPKRSQAVPPRKAA